MKNLVWDNRSATIRTVLLPAVSLTAPVALFALTGWAHQLLPAVDGEFAPWGYCGEVSAKGASGS